MNSKTLYQKLKQLLSSITSLVIVFTYICLLVETLKYPGFIGNHFFIDVKVYVTLAIVLILFTNIESKLLGLILKANRVFLVVISFIFLTLSLIEGAHYTNYVLATYRVHLDSMILLVLFSLFIFLAEKFKGELSNINIKGKMGVIYLVFVSLITFFIVKSANYVGNIAITQNSHILFHLRNSYDDKMTYQWKVFYQFMVFVKNNTPEDATIVIPPEQDPWLMGSGNENFVRAFLYPREIAKETLEIKDLGIYGENTYILITWGKEACNPDPSCHGWPKQKIKASRIVFKEPDSTNVVEVRENTTYDPTDVKYVYGVIEL